MILLLFHLSTDSTKARRYVYFIIYYYFKVFFIKVYNVNIHTYNVDPQIWSKIKERVNQTENRILSDIWDGQEYRKHSHFLSKPENLSLTCNTDGVSIYKSSTISIWPVWFVINELPPVLR